MSRQNSSDAKAYNMIVRQGLRLGTLKTVPADNFVVDKDMPPWLILSPAGAVDVLMPASNADCEGLTFLITNLGAGAITLKTSADAAFTTAIVLAATESTWVMCTGSATAALGWVAVGTTVST